MNNEEPRYFYGKFMHTPTRSAIEVLTDTLIEVAASGAITAITDHRHANFLSLLERARSSPNFHQFSTSQFLIPGLVDLHIHASQWPQLGKALHLPLQDWLMNCTFPLEARFADVDFASAVYQSLVQTLLANGTTSAVYFATIHPQATTRLAEICLEQGQRAWVGRVAMDDAQQCPDYYRDASTEAGLQQSEEQIHSIRAMTGNQSARVQPIITPRFIPSCSDEMLYGLGTLASQHQCHIQTHCSESDWEHQYVLDRCGQSDTHALQEFGLLTRRSVLAHSNFIGQSDMDTISSCGSGIAHCPLSNQYFADSVFPLRAALDKGLHVGLGTDISGGPSASMFDSCRAAISGSRMLEAGTNPDLAAAQRGVASSRINFIEAFYLGTVGGGVVLDEAIGKFEVGYQFDAMLIDSAARDSNLLYFADLDTDEDLFQKTLYAATRANIRAVWVGGQAVLPEANACH